MNGGVFRWRQLPWGGVRFLGGGWCGVSNCHLDCHRGAGGGGAGCCPLLLLRGAALKVLSLQRLHVVLVDLQRRAQLYGQSRQDVAARHQEQGLAVNFLSGGNQKELNGSSTFGKNKQKREIDI